jgi:dipeptide transport system ATP-binding protein
MRSTRGSRAMADALAAVRVGGAAAGAGAFRPLLDVRGLQVSFGGEPPAIAVDGLDLQVARGAVLGLVGESGCGKSVSMMALMGLVDPPGRVEAQRIAFDGLDLRAMRARERRDVIGRRIAMIFQDPVASLDPCYTVGAQLLEAIGAHSREPRARRRERAVELLRAVEIPDPHARLGAYPHQLSGGMCQRVMIAMALACEPELLIADEPTTALDVTIQAQIVDMLRRLQRERGLALVLISHDLALVAGVADRVVVMYAGQAMETGRPPAIFERPRHPYTAALMRALPEANRGERRLSALAGVVPGRFDRPAGCLLAPRCPQALERCTTSHPTLRAVGRDASVACHLADTDADTTVGATVGAAGGVDGAGG